ncbi:MAG TPA: DNA polymerase domain-containing protein, partial [Nitrososphaerales archaeon]|nr:DNA polymerase domain-containing protein [Nitrososphaerales archaeon]
MRGWLLDLYPGNPGEMIVWFKTEDGRAMRLVDSWSPSIFIAADSLADLKAPLKIMDSELVWSRPARMFEKVTDTEMSDVMEAKIRDATKVQQVAGRIERLGPFGAYRLYNVDVPPSQSYLYERGIFPLAYAEVTQTGGTLRWNLRDDVWSYDYTVPNLQEVKIDLEIAKERGKLVHFTDGIQAITLDGSLGKARIDTGSETDKLLELAGAIRDADPDFIFSTDGDTFLFPYLIERAKVNGVSDRMTLDRDGSILKLPTKGGTSYFSYGRIHYKPSAMKLKGRIHIDINSSFAYSEAGLEGLFELSRICRMPLQTSSRASIGKALSSLQFYHASRSNLLVPWKPTLVEHLKDRNQLLTADRGGFIFEPRMGVHEGVCELDFHALYPNIMLRKNISAETVRCPCCPDSKNRVPELDWNVCERKKGIVPRAIEIVVTKRLNYKRLKNDSKGTDRDRYNARQAVLKWLGVTTFGYLGFNNAKFGRIDAHIAVCAWDRKLLTDTARTAEKRGFSVVHGIVDSLWVKKEGAEREDYNELKSEIEEETGFAMSLEGIYKWIAFLPSRTDRGIPVLNRYFGAYQDNELKVRGIEARRHDTPRAFIECQMEILRNMAKADSVKEVKERLPECVTIFLRNANALEHHQIPASSLAFTTNLSKGPDEYTSMTIQHSAAKKLVQEGAKLHAGEGIRYVIT